MQYIFFTRFSTVVQLTSVGKYTLRLCAVPLDCLCKHMGNSSLFPTQTNSVEFPQMRESRLLLA